MTLTILAQRIVAAVALFLAAPLFAEEWPPSKEWQEQNKNSNDSSVTSIRCPSAEKCLPPGMCTYSDWTSGQEYVKYMCGGAEQEQAYGPLLMSCRETPAITPKDPNNVQPDAKLNCSEWFESRITNFEKCKAARKNFMHKCFLDGDQRHAKVVSELENGIEKCKTKLAEAKSLNLCK
jgi:Novel toxin 16